MEIDTLLSEFEQGDSDMIRFTTLEDGQWLPLIFIDQIKENNKAAQKENVKFEMPFFLDFENKDQVRKELESEYRKGVEEKSHILQKEKDKYLDELGTNLEKTFCRLAPDAANLADVARELLRSLKLMTPSQIDYEFRRFVFGSQENALRILRALSSLFDEPAEDFDLKNTSLNALLNVTILSHARTPLTPPHPRFTH